jgi:hypothetical protein
MVKNTCNFKESSSRKYSRNIRKPHKQKADKLFQSTVSKKERVVTKKIRKKLMNLQIICKKNNGNGDNYEEEIKKDVCVICCESSSNLKYINCRRGGLQNVKFGRYGKCCEDKPICWGCRDRCRDKCPFCNGHKLFNIGIRMRKKKKPFIEREKDRQKKSKIIYSPPSIHHL